MEPDFGGYATKANLVCSDGKTIVPSAFAHMDKMSVPLVWQHGHDKAENVLGHGVLEARPDGMYIHGYFNNSSAGQHARESVQHEDIKSLSIFARKLKMQGQSVMHGQIHEVSLVLAGANPGAKIDFVNIRHSDTGDLEEIDEAFITTGEEGLEVSHAAKSPAKPSDSNSNKEVGNNVAGTTDEETVKDVYNDFTDKQKNVVDYMIAVALSEAGASAQHSDDDDEVVEGEEVDETEKEETSDEGVAHQEGSEIVSNVFDRTNQDTKPGELKHHMIDEKGLKDLYQAAKRTGSLNTALQEYQLAHGIESIEQLFPDPKLLTATPDFNSRNMAWVQGVLDGTRKSPFSRIKTISADITQDEARALGYIKGNMKKEEWFSLISRTTTPTTIYKKQRLDRDDIVDTIDFDIVAWLKGEMRVMLSEEIAVAIMLGDGREVDDPDHISDPMGASNGAGIRSIMNDDDLYVTRANVSINDENTNWGDVVDQVLTTSEFYKGTGAPTFYSTQRTINKMLLCKDTLGRRLYDNMTALAAAMGVSNIVAVEPLLRFPSVLGIIVNLTDYNIGTDRGGEVNLFDDFDIDFNQYKYLMETRVSGALVKIKSAIVLNKVANTNTEVEPESPTFVRSTGVVTIPDQTGVVYKNAETSATLTAGPQTALAAGASIDIQAVPDTGYYFPTVGVPGVDQWTFKRPTS